MNRIYSAMVFFGSFACLAQAADVDYVQIARINLDVKSQTETVDLVCRKTQGRSSFSLDLNNPHDQRLHELFHVGKSGGAAVGISTDSKGNLLHVVLTRGCFREFTPVRGQLQVSELTEVRIARVDLDVATHSAVVDLYEPGARGAALGLKLELNDTADQQSYQTLLSSFVGDVLLNLSFAESGTLSAIEFLPWFPVVK